MEGQEGGGGHGLVRSRPVPRLHAPSYETVHEDYLRQYAPQIPIVGACFVPLGIGVEERAQLLI